MASGQGKDIASQLIAAERDWTFEEWLLALGYINGKLMEFGKRYPGGEELAEKLWVTAHDQHDWGGTHALLLEICQWFAQAFAWDDPGNESGEQTHALAMRAYDAFTNRDFDIPVPDRLLFVPML